MFVTVIIPVYNVAPYLKECIDSVINQSYKKLEIILVNDGSTDNSLEICNYYKKKDKRIFVIDQENAGLSAARNVGLLKANGEYILFLDSDDYYLDNDCITKLVEKARDKSPQMIMFQSVKYYEKKKRLVYSKNAIDTSKINNQKIEDILKYLIESGQPIACAWNKFLKRSLLIENEIFFKPGITGEDIDWIIKVFLKLTSMDILTADVHAYRQLRKGSITNSVSEKKILDLFNTIKKWADYCEDSHSNIKEEIQSFLAFEYAILIGRIPNLKDVKVINNIEKYSYLFEYAIDPKSQKVKRVFDLFGFKISSLIVYYYFSLSRLKDKLFNL